MAENYADLVGRMRDFLPQVESLLPPSRPEVAAPWHGGSAEFSVGDLVRAMEAAGDELKAKVAVVIDAAARGMVADHKARMPRSGRPHRPDDDPTPLADRVYVREYNPLLRVVYNNAPHLHLIELGTVMREAKRRNGRLMKSPANRGHVTASYSAGRTTFASLAQTRRAEMLRAAEALIGSREL